ncbi:MAG: tRNA (N6-threonylcarbamoyladenosine(37)-N6)-methyltransferase TrmO, partial [Eubacteriales bacterium]|nr:tRNA (N6-threonylcarbamoyladenosine(37)-N6)-methyltransferase TrmO [Eubacteriales bacterium]
PFDQRSALYEVLAQDPRPAYHKDPERIYGLSFAGQNIKFTVRCNVLQVTKVSPL